MLEEKQLKIQFNFIIEIKKKPSISQKSRVSYFINISHPSLHFLF